MQGEDVRVHGGLTLGISTMQTYCTSVLLLGFLLLPAVSSHNAYAGEPEQIAALRKLGADIDLNEDGNATRIVAPNGFTNADLKHLGGLPKLVSLDLSGTRVTNVGMATVKELKTLRDVDLMHLPISAEGTNCLTGLVQLNNLNLQFTHVDDEAVAHLTRIPDLEKLWLGHTRLTDAGLQHVARIESLSDLSLNSTQVTDAGIRHLSKLANLRSITLHDTGLTDRGLEELARLDGLEELLISGTEISGDGFRVISKLPNLRILDVSDTPISDEDVVPLASAARIERLSLLSTEIGDVGLERIGLAKMKNLRTLDLQCGKVTDKSLPLIQGSTKLKDLYLPRGGGVTDAGMKSIRGLTNLEVLTLAKPVGDAGVAEFADLVRLKVLSLRGSSITDVGLKQLKNMTQLESLNLYHTRITEDGLKHLEALTTLQELNVNATMVTREAVNRLKKVLPNTAIYGGRIRTGFIELEQNDPRVVAETRRLEGHWTAIAGQRGSEALPNPKEHWISFRENRVTVSVNTDEALAGDYRLDPTKAPSQIDIALWNDGWLEEMKAIYVVDKDELKICLILDSAGKRPNAFDVGSKEELRLIVYERTSGKSE